jgi:polyhydroxybutyrate depolymerase
MAAVRIVLAPALALGLGAITSCGGRGTPANGPSPAPSATSPRPADGAGLEPSDRAPATCSLAPGQVRTSLEVHGVAREYVRVVGEQVKAPAPVLLVWHGFGSNPEQMLAGVRPELWSDAILVAPLGLGRTFEQFGDRERPGFQVHAGELGDRDLKLFDAMLEELRATGCIDESRVYTTGFSNGGFFSNVLACHRGDRIAAAAPVGGGGPFVQGCGPPVPVLVTHGRTDEVVPFGSGEQTWAFWRRHDGCTDAAALPSEGCVDAEGCAAGSQVSACVFDGGHVWPPEQPTRVREFLVRHVRRPSAAP